MPEMKQDIKVGDYFFIIIGGFVTKVQIVAVSENHLCWRGVKFFDRSFTGIATEAEFFGNNLRAVRCYANS